MKLSSWKKLQKNGRSRRKRPYKEKTLHITIGVMRLVESEMEEVERKFHKLVECSMKVQSNFKLHERGESKPFSAFQ